MINFNCGKCKASIQSPDSMSGQIEVCPECGSPNIIPKLYIGITGKFEWKTKHKVILAAAVLSVLVIPAILICVCLNSPKKSDDVEKTPDASVKKIGPVEIDLRWKDIGQVPDAGCPSKNIRLTNHSDVNMTILGFSINNEPGKYVWSGEIGGKMGLPAKLPAYGRLYLRCDWNETPICVDILTDKGRIKITH